MRILAILTVRDEGAFLLEWLAHHRAAGITDFLVFSNDCSDGTAELLNRLATLGLIVHIPNPGPYHKRGIQFTALELASRHHLIAEADWILPLDIDEFVNVHVGDHRLPDLIDAAPEATAITLTWRLFGNAGVMRYEDGSLLDTFTQAAPEILHWPWRAAMFKTLYKNDGTYRKPGVHRPRAPRPDRLEEARWFDGHGRQLDARFLEGKVFSDFGRPNYGLAQLNHYPLGAMESFVLKADRGRAVHAEDGLGLDYWIERNFEDEEDTSIGALRAPRQAILEGLKADSEIARLHAAAVDWRHRRFATLMQSEANRALFGRLLMAAPSGVLPAALAEAIRAYSRP
ncbi:Glycosyl transferase family 2 [Poseidonocella pacifica]|uniref:Glycosyl transferase family 2 n=1 Tax=Poseidonocella pacifica TaxID=871651 RepID=A0A1I0V887_9RHOB|nr:glycosyltransferase family 2 protein [Poseidonocella pacifica]SFA71776.1 Glycosyl transferase family 2 [Poseidonocella pacifica]